MRRESRDQDPRRVGIRVLFVHLLKKSVSAVDVPFDIEIDRLEGHRVRLSFERFEGGIVVRGLSLRGGGRLCVVVFVRVLEISVGDGGEGAEERGGDRA